MRWFERVRDLLMEEQLSPVFFTANGGNFHYDDSYVLATNHGEVSMWGEVFPERGAELVRALQKGVITDLCLDSPRSDASGRAEWRATLSISLVDGIFHFGIDEQFISDPTVLLKRAFGMLKGVFEVHYGIAYKMNLSQEPDCYASGSRPFSFSQFRQWIHSRHDGTYKKSPDELWSEELSGERRHLTGFFRGAYPANIISNAHVSSAALTSRGIGKLTELDDSLWLWELAESEVPKALVALESRGVLVSQRTRN
jgi:hypothetical protein